MSNSSPSSEPVQLEQTHDYSTCETLLSLNQEISNQPDPPPPKFDAGNPPPPQSVIDPENNSPDEEENDDEEGGEIDGGGQEQEIPPISSGTVLHVDPPITSPPASVIDVTITSLPHSLNTRRTLGKRKGKGKGKRNIKKRLADEKKLQTLKAKLNPIPFIPHKILDFAKHENLLKKLGLWDFVHTDFDRIIRVDLIAHLIANYDPKSHASYVNNYRINISRADLARAFKLPKSNKRKAGGAEVDLEWEKFPDDSIGFISEFVSDWLLLHEDDAWMMPNEVFEWLQVINDGHPEKVDWATLVWFMVEKELKQGGQLRDCYYASHLQHLMRCQRKELFLTVGLGGVDPKEDDEVKETCVSFNFSGETKSPREEGCLVVGPSTELKLGQDDEKEKRIEDMGIMNVEKKDSDDDDEEIKEEPGQWLLHGKNEIGEHFMQHCSIENVEEFLSFEEKEVEEEIEQEEDEDEGRNKVDVYPSDEVMETNQIDMGVDGLHIRFTPSFFKSTGKRVIEHDDINTSHHANGSNKKLRTNDLWDPNPLDFGMCMEQIQHVTERAKMLYEEKEEALGQLDMNQHILLGELEKRDALIKHLHETRLDEVQKKDGEIFRLERELYLMESVLEGYRKALKETQRAFADYKEKAQLPEEPTYKDAGTGGLMLTAVETERLRKKREEEYKMCCLIVEQKMKEFEDDWAGRFDEYFKKVDIFESSLTNSASEVNELIELFQKWKKKRSEEALIKVFGPEEAVEAEEESISTAQTEEESDSEGSQSSS
ncbi:hypothetical protein OROGR_007001 [Orobanche gracilis]